MKRFNTTKRGYKFDKIIFYIIFILVTGFVMFKFYEYNFDFTPKPYFECKQAFCKNPLYQSDCKQQLKILWVIPLYTTRDCKEICVWCNKEILPKGIYGEKPDDYYMNNLGLFAFFLFMFGMVLNHLLHNRGKKFDLEIPITKKLIINRDYITEKLSKVEDDEKSEDNM